MQPEKSGVLTSTGHISGNFICTWKLDNFSRLDKDVGKSYFGQCINGGESKYESFDLLIYPGGKFAESEGFVSVYLWSKFEYAEKIMLGVTLELRNTEDKIFYIFDHMNFMAFDQTLGCPDLVEREKLIPGLINDVLVVQAKIAFTMTFISGANGTTERYAETFSESIFRDMRELQIEDEGADVVISVEEEDIPAHYAMLVARSKRFADMFEQDITEKSYRHVSITDFDLRSVKALLQFMYTGSIEILTINVAKDMLRAADQYGMDDLKIYCSNYLISRLDNGNIFNIAITADTYNASKLREKSIQFICEHASEFDFEQHLSELAVRGELLVDILKRMAAEVDP